MMWQFSRDTEGMVVVEVGDSRDGMGVNVRITLSPDRARDFSRALFDEAYAREFDMQNAAIDKEDGQ